MLPPVLGTQPQPPILGTQPQPPILGTQPQPAPQPGTLEPTATPHATAIGHPFTLLLFSLLNHNGIPLRRLHVTLGTEPRA